MEASSPLSMKNISGAMDCCSDAIIVIDHLGIVRLANRKAELLLEKKQGEILGRPLLISNLNGNAREMLITRPNGEQIIVEVLRENGEWNERPALVLTLHDITDQKYRQAAQMVEANNRMQVEKWQSLESLAGGIAHQFNNLLMVILGHCSLMMRGSGLDARLVTGLGYIERSSLRAAEITNHLIAFAGLGKYEFASINLSQTIESIKYLFETITLKRARIDYNLDHNIPAVNGDEAQIQRMLFEIISNATESLGRDKGVISITTGVTSHQPSEGNQLVQCDRLPEGDYVYIQISDTGCGMDEETQTRIFQPFFSTKTSGKGLGLSAALGIARAHKGTIYVHTVPNFGTTVEIFLPAATADKEELSDISSFDITPEIDEATGRILIAEDEAYLREMLQEALQSMGYEVVASEDGRECLERFKASDEEFDCVILDMSMPNLDGEETFTAIRNLGSEVPVIMTSGFTNRAGIERLRKAGVTFLQKPYQLSVLMSLLGETIGGEKVG
jgi:signal transduction histidine kinase/CheY-like chemotaxis protein